MIVEPGMFHFLILEGHVVHLLNVVTDTNVDNTEGPKVKQKEQAKKEKDNIPQIREKGQSILHLQTKQTHSRVVVFRYAEEDEG